MAPEGWPSLVCGPNSCHAHDASLALASFLPQANVQTSNVALEDQLKVLNVVLKQHVAKAEADKKAADIEAVSMANAAKMKADEAQNAQAKADFAAAELLAAKEVEAEKAAAEEAAAEKAAAAKSVAEKAAAEKAAAKVAAGKAGAAKAAADIEVAGKMTTAMEAAAQAAAKRCKAKQTAAELARVVAMAEGVMARMAVAESLAVDNASIGRMSVEKAGKTVPVDDDEGFDRNDSDDDMPAAAPVPWGPPSNQTSTYASNAIRSLAQGPVSFLLRTANHGSTTAVGKAIDLTDPDDPSDDGRLAASSSGNCNFAAAAAAPLLACNTTPPTTASSGKRKAGSIGMFEDSCAKLSKGIEKGKDYKRSEDIIIVPRDSELAPTPGKEPKNPNKNPPVRIIGSKMRMVTGAGHGISQYDTDAHRMRILGKVFEKVTPEDIFNPLQSDPDAVSAHCKVLALRGGVPVGDRGDSSAMKYCGYVAQFMRHGFVFKSEFVKSNNDRAECVALKAAKAYKAANPDTKLPADKYAKHYMCGFRLYCDLLEKERSGEINAQPPTLPSSESSSS